MIAAECDDDTNQGVVDTEAMYVEVVAQAPGIAEIPDGFLGPVYVLGSKSAG